MQKYTSVDVINIMNQNRPQFLTDLGCQIVEVDIEQGICKMDFNIHERYCHSVDIIQGGFVTAMLDAVSTHAIMARDSTINNVSTLELKVSFFAASRKGICHAIGRIEKITRNFAFVSADLFDLQGKRTASLTSTAKIHKKPTS